MTATPSYLPHLTRAQGHRYRARKATSSTAYTTDDGRFRVIFEGTREPPKASAENGDDRGTRKPIAVVDKDGKVLARMRTLRQARMWILAETMR